MKRLSIVIGALALALVIMLAPARAGIAAETSINISDTGVSSDFPRAMSFRFQGTSASEISDVRLHYVVDKMNYATVVSEAWPKFSPGTSVKTQWVWDMRKSSLPPSAAIEYWWTAENAAGVKAESRKQRFVFEDTRYPWKNIKSGSITLYWYQGDNAFAQTLLNSAQDGMARLNKDTGLRLDSPVRLFIYATSQDLQGAMIFAREWTGGVAYADHGIISLGINTRNLDWGKNAVVHELGHFAVSSLTYGPYESTMPVWLNEGMAMYAEGTPDQYQQSYLDKAIKEDKLISLRSLSSPFSALPDQAVLSYAESFSAVSFLIKNYGQDKILRLFSSFKEGATADESLQKIYGFDQDGLYSLWRASVGAKSK